jgi:hypothetical protein
MARLVIGLAGRHPTTLSRSATGESGAAAPTCCVAPRIEATRLFGQLGRSFKTTNCLESVNGQVEARVAKVDHWKNSSQRHRWMATALLDIEPRLRRVMGLHHLPALREAIQRDLKIGKHAVKQMKASPLARMDPPLLLRTNPFELYSSWLSLPDLA